MEPNKAFSSMKRNSNGSTHDFEPAVVVQLMKLVNELKANMAEMSKSTVSAIQGMRQTIDHTQESLKRAIEMMCSFPQRYEEESKSQARDIMEQVVQFIVKRHDMDKYAETVRSTLSDSITELQVCIERQIMGTFGKLSQSLQSSRYGSSPRSIHESVSEGVESGQPDFRNREKQKNLPVHNRVIQVIRKPQQKRPKGRPRKFPLPVPSDCRSNVPIYRTGRRITKMSLFSEAVECSVANWFDESSWASDSGQNETANFQVKSSIFRGERHIVTLKRRTA